VSGLRIEEGRLAFKFDEGWTAIKYDGHHAYRQSVLLNQLKKQCRWLKARVLVESTRQQRAISGLAVERLSATPRPT
jgi:hypothetical protein